MRRTWLRGIENVRKRYTGHIVGQNLSRLMWLPRRIAPLLELLGLRELGEVGRALLEERAHGFDVLG